MRIELNLNEEYTDKIRKLMEKNGLVDSMGYICDSLDCSSVST